jgi:hypothetical protein
MSWFRKRNKDPSDIEALQGSARFGEYGLMIWPLISNLGEISLSNHGQPLSFMYDIRATYISNEYNNGDNNRHVNPVLMHLNGEVVDGQDPRFRQAAIGGCLMVGRTVDVVNGQFNVGLSIENLGPHPAEVTGTDTYRGGLDWPYRVSDISALQRTRQQAGGNMGGEAAIAHRSGSGLAGSLIAVPNALLYPSDCLEIQKTLTPS